MKVFNKYKVIDGATHFEYINGEWVSKTLISLFGTYDEMKTYTDAEINELVGSHKYVLSFDSGGSYGECDMVECDLIVFTPVEPATVSKITSAVAKWEASEKERRAKERVKKSAERKKAREAKEAKERKTLERLLKKYGDS